MTPLQAALRLKDKPVQDKERFMTKLWDRGISRDFLSIEELWIQAGIPYKKAYTLVQNWADKDMSTE